MKANLMNSKNIFAMNGSIAKSSRSVKTLLRVMGLRAISALYWTHPAADVDYPAIHRRLDYFGGVAGFDGVMYQFAGFSDYGDVDSYRYSLEGYRQKLS